MGDLTFDDASHTYKDNAGQYISVTSFIATLFPKFDSWKIAGFVAKKRGVTRQIILDEWEELADIGKAVGHELHTYIENRLAYRQFSPLVDDHLIEAYQRWEQKNIYPYGDLLPVATELIIKSKKYPLAGTIDLLTIDLSTEELVIVDWKSNKKDLGPTIVTKPVITEIPTIPDSNYGKYSLQLNLYRLILMEICSTITYGTPRIVWLGSPDGQPKEYHAVDILDSLIELLDHKFASK